MVLPHFPLQQEHVQLGDYSGRIMNVANNQINFTLDPTTGRLAREGARESTYGDEEYSESKYSTTTGMSTISSKKTNTTSVQILGQISVNTLGSKQEMSRFRFLFTPNS
jgi:hypothetical protein